MLFHPPFPIDEYHNDDVSSWSKHVLPKRYTAEQHKISSDKIDQHAFYVIEKLRQAGHKAYLVGGGVRDLLLNVRPKDFDVSTSASPEEIRELFRSAILIGRRFRLAHVRFGKKIIEVSTFRAGDIESSELILRDNVWGTEEEDVLRRDFTINGLFYDPHSQLVIDYVDGYPDLEKKILRTIGQPVARFSQDPVRMIRLIKFSARFQFEIDKPTFEALLTCRKEIVKSSSARVFEELLRMLESGAAKPFFHLLQEYGLLVPLLPELAFYLERKDESGLTLKLLSEIDSEIQKREKENHDRSLLLSALVFPLFDQYLKEYSKSQDKPLHLGQIGAAAHHVIECIFSSFFKMPRRIKAVMAFILTSQYRFIPIDGKSARPRPLKDPFSSLGLQLLKIRSAVQSELLPQYTLWTESVFAGHVSEPEMPKPKRRRRRRRR